MNSASKIPENPKKAPEKNTLRCTPTLVLEYVFRDWLVLRRACHPGTRSHHDTLMQVLRRGPGKHIWIVLCWPRPPRREANHEGMLRSGVPRGGVTYPKCGWFCTGPGLLGERPITTACCDQRCRAGGVTSVSYTHLTLPTNREV